MTYGKIDMEILKIAESKQTDSPLLAKQIGMQWK